MPHSAVRLRSGVEHWRREGRHRRASGTRPRHPASGHDADARGARTIAAALCFRRTGRGRGDGLPGINAAAPRAPTLRAADRRRVDRMIGHAEPPVRPRRHLRPANRGGTVAQRFRGQAFYRPGHQYRDRLARRRPLRPRHSDHGASDRSGTDRVIRARRAAMAEASTSGSVGSTASRGAYASRIYRCGDRLGTSVAAVRHLAARNPTGRMAQDETGVPIEPCR